MRESTKNIAIVGTGYWGKNLVRSFCEILGGKRVACCDLDQERLDEIRRQHPNVSTTQTLDSILSDREIDAVVIATPAVTHFDLANKALLAGKHVFVEKPIAMNSEDAESLINIADKMDRRLMVDHLLEYHPVVEEMKRGIEEGELGRIYYLYSQRVNLGIVRTEENALWSLGSHDISVFLYLLEREPIQVSAQGAIYLQKEKGIEDVVFLDLVFAEGVLAHAHLSWLDPHKIRKITIVGSERMMVFDDMESRDKLKIFDKRAERRGEEAEFNVRYGEASTPNIESKEPLKSACLHFLKCIEEDKVPRSDGRDGLRVLRVLEAAQDSLKNGGKPIRV